MLQAFPEANHRTGRLLQDFILMDSGYPPVFISDIPKYEKIIRNISDKPGSDLRPFIRFIYDCLKETIEIVSFYIRRLEIPQN
jgi:Fic family protein